jgi:hypothetical protein
MYQHMYQQLSLVALSVSLRCGSLRPHTCVAQTETEALIGERCWPSVVAQVKVEAVTAAATAAAAVTVTAENNHDEGAQQQVGRGPSC